MRKSIILSLFLLLFSVTAYAEYSDMPYDWSYESMSWAVESGIINGSDGKIYPDGYMTRADRRLYWRDMHAKMNYLPKTVKLTHIPMPTNPTGFMRTYAI